MPNPIHQAAPHRRRSDLLEAQRRSTGPGGVRAFPKSPSLVVLFTSPLGKERVAVQTYTHDCWLHVLADRSMDMHMVTANAESAAHGRASSPCAGCFMAYAKSWTAAGVTMAEPRLMYASAVEVRTSVSVDAFSRRYPGVSNAH